MKNDFQKIKCISLLFLLKLIKMEIYFRSYKHFKLKNVFQYKKIFLKINILKKKKKNLLNQK